MEEKSLTEIESSYTLYDLNKSIYGQVTSLTDVQIEEKKEKIIEYMDDTKQTYFMLLNNEKRDYTIFRSDKTTEGNSYNATVMLEIAQSRGNIAAIEYDEVGLSYHVWIQDPNMDNNSFCYVFFPCDCFVIDEV